MITEAILDFLHGLAVAVFGWAKGALPDPPTFVADLNDAIDTVFLMVPEGVRYFVPLGPAVTAGLSVVGLLVACGLVVVARRVLSLFTGGGGNA